MYTFLDRSGRSLTLRPEGTAPVVRAYLEERLYTGIQPVKLYYLGPMFRYGRPQSGRLRQFHQFGVELLGSKDPAADAEVISLALDFYRRLDLKGVTLRLNSVGCPVCRQRYREAVRAFVAPRLEELCPTCRDRYDRNPLRILDCKSPVCREVVATAPDINDYLCSECTRHFARVRDYLEEAGVAYLLDPRVVRGLDYYTGTAFEIEGAGLGAQSALGGGGRYDGLVELLGGPPTPAVGFGLGLERTLLALEGQGVRPAVSEAPPVFVARAGEGTDRLAWRIVTGLRRAGMVAEQDYLGRSLKAQMKQADRLGAMWVVIIGDDEAARGTVLVRHMATGQQEEVSQDKLTAYLQSCGTKLDAD